MESVNDTPTLDPATFDLGAFVADKATYATYTCTVYLAADQARRSAHLADERDRLALRLDRLIDQADNTAPAHSLGETDPTQRDIAQIRDRIRAIDAERAPLVEAVKNSALTLTFSVVGRSTQKRVAELVSAQEDPETMGTDRMFEQARIVLGELLRSVTTPQGTVMERTDIPDHDLDLLVERLSVNDLTRLSQTMSLALTGSFDIDRAIDAGFPR